MKIGPLMSTRVVTIGPDHSVVEAARHMRDARVGSAVVTTEDGRPGIFTERDVLRAIADGVDPEKTTVENYMTADAITASPSWDLEDAARRMIEGGFRHLLVLGESGQVAGVLSMRDIVPALLEGFKASVDSQA